MMPPTTLALAPSLKMERRRLLRRCESARTAQATETQSKRSEQLERAACSTQRAARIGAWCWRRALSCMSHFCWCMLLRKLMGQHFLYAIYEHSCPGECTDAPIRLCAGTFSARDGTDVGYNCVVCR